jgi:isoamylase
VNYWGYAPVSFFAPHRAYSSRQDTIGPVDEFRDMVKALHRAGIEVVLDVVCNHTTEGDQRGPTVSFRGIDHPTYYILEEGGSRYANYTGCGNILNANHPVVRRMVVDSLRYRSQGTRSILDHPDQLASFLPLLGPFHLGGRFPSAGPRR